MAGETAVTVNQLASFAEGLDDITLTTADDANNNMFANDGKTLLVIYNGSAGGLTVVVEGVASPDNYNQAKDVTCTVGAGDIGVYGPFHTSNFNDSSGNVILTVADDGTDTLKLAAVRLPVRNV